MDGGFRVQPELTKELAEKLALRIQTQVEEDRGNPKLRLSQISHPCDRKIWYDINMPEAAEPLSAETKIKFLYGHILEEMVLFLAKVSGHTVEGEQDEVNLYGVPGHRDAIIDGCLVDVKSASTFAFYKFAGGLKLADDGFGYLGQLDSYLEGSQLDDKLKVKDKGYFLAIDKQLGKLALDEHPRLDINWRKRVFEIQSIVADRTPPPRAFSSVSYGASGNKVLDTVCSYCVHKRGCWAGLRAYNYSNGPKFFTEVNKEPRDVARLF